MSNFSELAENSINDASDIQQPSSEHDRGVDRSSFDDPEHEVTDQQPSWMFRWQMVLWPAHQVLLAVAAVFALLFIAIYFGGLGSQSNGLINIDEAKRLKFQFQVDINEAESNELFAIPGIGKTLADRIVEYREQNGKFGSLDDLEKVPGLGPKSIERIRPFVLRIQSD